MLLQTLFCSIYIIYTFSNSYLKPTERFLGFPQIVVYYPYASIIDNEIDGTREIFYNLFCNYWFYHWNYHFLYDHENIL